MIKLLLVLLTGVQFTVFGTGGCRGEPLFRPPEMRRVQVSTRATERPRMLRHYDFAGGDEFDWCTEDRGWSSFLNPVCTWQHFRGLESVERDVAWAVERCDRVRFERYVHEGQDWFAHTWRRPRHNVVGHVFCQWWDGTRSVDGRLRWLCADRWTRVQVKLWRDRLMRTGR